MFSRDSTTCSGIRQPPCATASGLPAQVTPGCPARATRNDSIWQRSESAICGGTWDNWWLANHVCRARSDSVSGWVLGAGRRETARRWRRNPSKNVGGRTTARAPDVRGMGVAVAGVLLAIGEEAAADGGRLEGAAAGGGVRGAGNGLWSWRCVQARPTASECSQMAPSRRETGQPQRFVTSVRDLMTIPAARVRLPERTCPRRRVPSNSAEATAPACQAARAAFMACQPPVSISQRSVISNLIRGSVGESAKNCWRP